MDRKKKERLRVTFGAQHYSMMDGYQIKDQMPLYPWSCGTSPQHSLTYMHQNPEKCLRGPELTQIMYPSSSGIKKI